MWAVGIISAAYIEISAKIFNNIRLGMFYFNNQKQQCFSGLFTLLHLQINTGNFEKEIRSYG